MGLTYTHKNSLQSLFHVTFVCLLPFILSCEAFRHSSTSSFTSTSSRSLFSSFNFKLLFLAIYFHSYLSSPLPWSSPSSSSIYRFLFLAFLAVFSLSFSFLSFSGHLVSLSPFTHSLFNLRGSLHFSPFILPLPSSSFCLFTVFLPSSGSPPTVLNVWGERFQGRWDADE